MKKRNRNTSRETTFRQVRRETRTLNQEKRCVLRQGADRSRSQGCSRVLRTSRRFTEVMHTSRGFTKFFMRRSRRFTEVMRTSRRFTEVMHASRGFTEVMRTSRGFTQVVCELKIHKTHAYELKIQRIRKIHAVRSNVMTQPCNQLLRIQLTRQERSQSHTVRAFPV